MEYWYRIIMSKVFIYNPSLLLLYPESVPITLVTTGPPLILSSTTSGIAVSFCPSTLVYFPSMFKAFGLSSNITKINKQINASIKEASFSEFCASTWPHYLFEMSD